ncbi:MAG: YbhB/YbcL family Raf kinase inhibitor-like protein, partial [Thiohalorhabdaceae bacterium]
MSWSGAPEGTQSFALICDDPDAPGGTFAHWAVYDIPADVGYLESGHSNPQRSSPYKEGVNDMGRASWGGPCPPEGHGTHHYQFRILA